MKSDKVSEILDEVQPLAAASSMLYNQISNIEQTKSYDSKDFQTGSSCQGTTT